MHSCVVFDNMNEAETPATTIIRSEAAELEQLRAENRNLRSQLAAAERAEQTPSTSERHAAELRRDSANEQQEKAERETFFTTLETEREEQQQRAEAGGIEMEPKTTDKRIVSKGEYVQAVGKRESIRLLGVCLLLTAGTLGFIILSVFGMFGINVITCFIGSFCGILTYFIGKWGVESINKAAAVKPVVPFTRANTADLPAPDSLVRASAEPMQAQQAVLLRAAEKQETPPEQLVRAVGGQE